ncbi:MAG: nucleoside-diphosphate sugar epimerase/dehydratase [Deltaproteobacteria bacterium]
MNKHLKKSEKSARVTHNSGKDPRDAMSRNRPTSVQFAALRELLAAFKGFIHPHLRYNYFLFVAICAACASSFWLAYRVRFDFDVPERFLIQCSLLLPFVVAMKLAVFYVIRAQSENWRYVSLRGMTRLVWHAVICGLILVGWSVFGHALWIPRGVIFIDVLLTLIFIGGVRISARIFREQVFTLFRNGGESQRLNVAIIGAGDAGEMVIREIMRNPSSGLAVQALFDDDPAKKAMRIHGIRVVGGVDRIESYLRSTSSRIDLAIVAIPSASRAQMKRINDTLRNVQIPVKTLPPILELLEKSSALSQLRDLNISDLLGREEITIDDRQVCDLIRDRVVLVTGAGGSIGSELCRQVLIRGPRALVLLERAENNLFHLHRKLTSLDLNGQKTSLIPCLCDVTHEQAVTDILRRYRPHVVFHAAAHKHVTMQELNPRECFTNNVGGIHTLAGACDKTGVERFLLISTDKAVNPTCVMGATKRVCEIYCQAFGHVSNTKFLTVRFGNVLASEGSVVPIFMEQIAKGGPVTVTHPDVKRFFMTIPEAVVLVLQATAIGESGQIMVLDMGEPIKIVDLARHLITLAGKNRYQIPIEFVGLTPGEKLFEELCGNFELCQATAHDKIRIYNGLGENPREVIARIEWHVRRISKASSRIDVRAALRDIVPEYKPGQQIPTEHRFPVLIEQTTGPVTQGASVALRNPTFESG